MLKFLLACCSLTLHTCPRSMSDAYDRNRAAQRNAIDLDFSFDVYYHTAISDPRCMVGPGARFQDI